MSTFTQNTTNSIAPTIIEQGDPGSGRVLSRVNWVDVVKGMSIFLVVMMHSTLGVQIAVGETSWMGNIVEFARPFRIPCFMLISGLFLHRSINGEWISYLDRKIVHFVYFYVLWVTIQIIVKTPAWMGEGLSLADVFQVYLKTFVQPFGTLWFIYMLPVFYLVTRLLRNVDWKILLGGAILLQILPIHTGATLIDEFASRYVYFVIGYLFYEQIFAFSAICAKRLGMVALFIAGWFVLNALLTNSLLPQQFHYLFHPTGAGPIGKLADLPLISLGSGILGCLAMIATGVAIMQFKAMAFMRWVGEHSIVVYLVFFLPMGVSRIILLKFAGDVLSTGMIAAIVTICAASGPIIFYWFLRKTGFGMFLFERPNIARLKSDGKENPNIQPA